MRPAAEVFDRGFVGVDVAATCTAFDAHVADGHPLFHRHPVEDLAGVLVGVADASLHAEDADDVQRDVFGVDARPQLAVDLDSADVRAVERHRLRREDVGDLARADPERDRAERPVRAGVAVAADDRHAGLGQPELRPDDMHDPLEAAAEVEQLHAELAAVPLDRRHHLFGEGIDEGTGLAVGRDDVIDGGDGPLGVGDRQSAFAEHREGLRAGDLVHEMQPDEELRLPARQVANGVEVPDLVEEITAIGHRFGRAR